MTSNAHDIADRTDWVIDITCPATALAIAL